MGRLWNKLSYLGVNEDMGFETARKLILMNRISFVLFLLVISIRTFVIFIGFQEFTYETFFPFLAISTILIFPFLNKKGFYKISVFSFTALTPIFALYFGVSSQVANEVVNINHYYYPRMLQLGLLVLPLVLIENKNKFQLYFSLFVNIACILFFDRATYLFGVPFSPETVSYESHSMISRLMLTPVTIIVSAFFFLRYLNKKYEEQITGLNQDLINKNKEMALFNEEVTTQRDTIISKNELLEKANFKIESINKDLTDSIVYAKRIQRAVFRKEFLPDGYFEDSFIYLKAKTHVSGDFYYYKKIQIGEKKGLVVTSVDCTGHGVPGGFLSMLGMVLLNDIILYETITNAADILNHLRRKVKETLKQKGMLEEQKDGMDMALCIYYPETKELDFAGARNPLYIVGENIVPTLLKGDRQPVGVYEKERNFTNHRIRLNGGEMLYLFSDGLQDQFGGEKGKKLKIKKLVEYLNQISVNSCSVQKQSLIDFMYRWTHPKKGSKYEQIDDIVIVGMRI